MSEMKDSHRWTRTVGRLNRQRAARRVDGGAAPAGEAHRRTEAVLRRLPDEAWSIVAGPVRDGAGAHVAVGPGGVYLIASHEPGGCVRVKEGVAWLRHGEDSRSDRPSPALQRKVADPARHLQRELAGRGSSRAAVHAVVVLWSEFPQRVAETSQVAYVHGRNLTAWLQARGEELADGERGAVADAVARVLADPQRRTPRIARRHAA